MIVVNIIALIVIFCFFLYFKIKERNIKIIKDLFENNEVVKIEIFFESKKKECKNCAVDIVCNDKTHITNLKNFFNAINIDNKLREKIILEKTRNEGLWELSQIIQKAIYC